MSYKYFFIFSFLCLGFSTFAQSPWVDDKGSVYAQLSLNSFSYESIFDAEGSGAQNTFETTDRTLGFFGSYSISDKLGIQVDLPYKLVSTNGNSLNAIGDLSFDVKYELLNSFPLTAFAGYTAPTATREGALRTGYQQHSVDVGLSTGFSKGSAYGYFGAGHRYRANIPNQITIDTEIGTKANLGNRDLFLIFHIDGALNLEETTDPEGDESVLYHNNGQFLSPGIKFSLNVIDNWWINFGGYGAITARNQGANASLSIGIAYKTSAE